MMLLLSNNDKISRASCTSLRTDCFKYRRNVDFSDLEKFRPEVKPEVNFYFLKFICNIKYILYSTKYVNLVHMGIVSAFLQPTKTLNLG